MSMAVTGIFFRRAVVMIVRTHCWQDVITVLAPVA